MDNNYQSQADTLTTRLDKMDKFRSEYQKQAGARIMDMTGVPDTYNPLESYSAMSNLMADSSTRNALESRQQSATQQWMDYQAKIKAQEEQKLQREQALKQQDRENKLAERKMQLEEQKAGVSYDPALGNYGTIAQTDPEVDTMANAIIREQAKLSDVSAEKKPAVVARLADLGYDPSKNVRNIVDELKSLYSGQTDIQGNAIQGDTLSEGSTGLGLAYIRELWHLGGQVFKTERGQREALYNSKKTAFVTQMKKLVGDAGIPTKADIQAWSKLFPSFTDTPEEAENKFATLYAQLPQQIQPTGNYASAGGAKSTSGKVTMISPDGQRYMVDPTEVQEAISNGWKRY